MNLVFVHGWSVSSTETYGDLPEALAAQAPEELELSVTHINLGEYISFHDEVTVADIARAFEVARIDALGAETEFSCITHSTGGPVIRQWIDMFYGAEKLASLPVKHLVMLAPANFGSALAQLGKSQVGRLKSWFEGVEPGQGVLNWLELGSDEAREVNINWLKYKTVSNGFYPVVITGDSIARSLIDYVNSYTDEKGSDGVVRVAATNLNYRHLKLKQDIKAEPFDVTHIGDTLKVYPLQLDGLIEEPIQSCALEIIPRTSHSGKKMGIMRSVTKRYAQKRPVWQPLIDALSVNSAEEYDALVATMSERTEQNQSGHKYSMVIFRVFDDHGKEITDYDLLFLGGANYKESVFKKGLFKDRQKNKLNNCALTYYIDHNLLASVPDNLIGFRVIARPDSGFSYYSAAEFHSDKLTASQLINGNETVMVDIVLKRNVDTNTFKLVALQDDMKKSKKAKSFKDVRPSGNLV